VCDSANPDAFAAMHAAVRRLFAPFHLRTVHDQALLPPLGFEALFGTIPVKAGKETK
jgi:hypothetical protein